MASYSVSRRPVVNRTSDNKQIFVTADWTLMQVFLESSAGGSENFVVIGGGSGYRVEPGGEIRMFLAPGTRVEVDTNSDQNVEWSFAFTQMDFFGLIDQALGAIHDQLDQIRCGGRGVFQEEPRESAAVSRAKVAPEEPAPSEPPKSFTDSLRLDRSSGSQIAREPAPTRISRSFVRR